MFSRCQPTFELVRTWCPCFSKIFCCCCCKNESSEERTLLKDNEAPGGKEMRNFLKPPEDFEDSEEEKASKRRIAEHKKQLEEKRLLAAEKANAEVAEMRKEREKIEKDLKSQEKRLSELVKPRRSEGAGNGDEIVESSDDEEAQIHKEFQEKIKIQNEQYGKKLENMQKRKLIRQELAQTLRSCYGV